MLAPWLSLQVKVAFVASPLSTPTDHNLNCSIHAEDTKFLFGEEKRIWLMDDMPRNDKDSSHDVSNIVSFQPLLLLS